VNDLEDTMTDRDAEILMDVASDVLGDPGKLEEALAEIGAFVGRNDRFEKKGTMVVRHWDAYGLRDVRDAETGEVRVDAPAGALLYALLFGDEKTSARCRYVLAERVEKQLQPEIDATFKARMTRFEEETL
jgi:hypothetical protein